MLLTESDWKHWFDVSGDEAGRLVAVQEALLGAGFCPCPDAVVGLSRSLLGEPDASTKLRALADLWDETPVPARVDPDSHWPELGGPGFESLLRSHLWLRAIDEPRPVRCRHRGR